MASVVVPIQDQRTAVRHGAGHGLGDALLAGRVQPLALAVGDVLDGGSLDAHAAMKARQQPGFRDVAPHGLQRDVEAFGEFFDRG